MPQSKDTKQAHIQTTTLQAARDLTTIISEHGPTTNAHPSMTPPMTGTCLNDIDSSPPLNTLFPGNCRLKNCHLHCCLPEINVDTNDTSTIANLEYHGITYHSDLLHATPSPLLSQISWYKCVIGCEHLSFTLNNFRSHQTQCNIHQNSILNTRPNTTTHQPNTTQHSSQASISSSKRQDNLHHLQKLCPPEHLEEFEHLVQQGKTVKTITSKLLGWMDDPSTHTLGTPSKKND